MGARNRKIGISPLIFVKIEVQRRVTLKKKVFKKKDQSKGFRNHMHQERFQNKKKIRKFPLGSPEALSFISGEKTLPPP